MARSRKSEDDLNEEAARWVARLDNDASRRAEFETWVANDKRRYIAFVRAQAAFGMLDVLGPEARDDAPDSKVRSALKGPLLTRRRMLVGAAAAAVPLALGVGLGFLRRAGAYETSFGEVKTVPLPDGSSMTMNTGSRVLASFHPRARHIEVATGEVSFDVVHDAGRPFVVKTDFARIQSTVTRFLVRAERTGSEVVVEQGSVDAWSERGSERDAMRLGPGARLYATNASLVPLQPLNPDELERNLAWRNGHVVFDGETLADAVERLNAYNEKKIVLADRGLANERVVGYFKLKDPAAFATAVAAAFGAQAKATPDAILLYSAPKKS